MTTVVGDRTRLVSDSRVSGNNNIIYDSPKLFRVKDAIIGCAGDNEAIEAFIKWYGSKKRKPKFKEDSFDALVVTKSGIYTYDETCSRDLVLGPWAAIGSGGSAALGALHMGASLEDACKIACKVDKYSGEPIQIMELDEKPTC